MLPYLKKKKNTRWRHRPFAMKLVRFIVHTSSTKADFIMKCELDPVYQGEGNTGARVTLALAHFFFKWSIYFNIQHDLRKTLCKGTDPCYSLFLRKKNVPAYLICLPNLNTLNLIG